VWHHYRDTDSVGTERILIVDDEASVAKLTRYPDNSLHLLLQEEVSAEQVISWYCPLLSYDDETSSVSVCGRLQDLMFFTFRTLHKMQEVNAA